jgi:acyl carrier protein
MGRGSVRSHGENNEMSSDVHNRVVKVVAHTLKVDEGRVTDDARFVEDLGAESMQSVELIASFEEEFDIEMDEQAALGVKTVGSAVEFISTYLD